MKTNTRSARYQKGKGYELQHVGHSIPWMSLGQGACLCLLTLWCTTGFTTFEVQVDHPELAVNHANDHSMLGQLHASKVRKSGSLREYTEPHHFNLTRRQEYLEALQLSKSTRSHVTGQYVGGVLHRYDLEDAQIPLEAEDTRSISSNNYDEEYIRRTKQQYTKPFPIECQGKERLIMLYLESNSKIPKTLCSKLPDWETVTKKYGNEPVIIKDCGRRRKGYNTSKPLDARVSVLPEVGSALLKRLLKDNFPDMDVLERKVKNLIDVKKSTAEQSLLRRDLTWHLDPPGDYFRVILVGDPYNWMQNICLTTPEVFGYGNMGSKEFKYTDGKNNIQDACPFLLTPRSTKKYGTVPLYVRVDTTSGERYDHYDSLIDYWNKWVAGYIADPEPNDFESRVPYIVIRYEDMLMHPKQVALEIATCSGHEAPEPYVDIRRTYLGRHEVKRWKRKPIVGLFTRWINEALPAYLGDSRRTNGFTEAELQYARRSLNGNILKMLHYHHP